MDEPADRQRGDRPEDQACGEQARVLLPQEVDRVGMPRLADVAKGAIGTVA